MHKMMLLYFLLIIPLVRGDTIVTTNSGPVRGVSEAGRKVEAFLSIPYAEPPVGPLRFARPVPKSPWKETIDTNQLPPHCVQMKLENLHFPYDWSKLRMSEDCLFLNLWVPEGGSDKKTVMVWIHGGGYMLGSSSQPLYNGAKLAERGDVIVASINYRVGTLGFFSGFIDEAGGNMGLYDQVLALQWIKDNVKNFGGDPDNIVLFGESAGGFSVSFHMISPLSKNLFRRSILMSGSSFSPMTSGGNTGLEMGSQAIASMLGCSEDDGSLKTNPKSVVDCMKGISAEKISETDLEFFKKIGWLSPRSGDEFLPKNPIDLYREGNFKEQEVLLGVTRDEGSLFYSLEMPNVVGIHGEKVDPRSVNETMAKELFLGLVKGNKAIGEIFKSYSDRVKDSSRDSYLHAASEAFGDFLIACGAVFQADFQSLKDTSVYFYLFNYRPSSTTLAEWQGVAHFEEVQYVFGNPMYEDFTEFEEELSRDMQDMWIAFAKTGNPSIPGGVKWPRYHFEDPKYYIIGKRDGVGIRPDNYRCEAWRKMYRSVVDED